MLANYSYSDKIIIEGSEIIIYEKIKRGSGYLFIFNIIMSIYISIRLGEGDVLIEGLGNNEFDSLTFAIVLIFGVLSLFVFNMVLVGFAAIVQKHEYELMERYNIKDDKVFHL